MKPTIWRRQIINATTIIADGNISHAARSALLDGDLLSTFLTSDVTRVRNIQKKQGVILIDALHTYESSKSNHPQKADIQQLALLFLQTMDIGPAKKKEWSGKYFICTCKKQSEISAGLSAWIPMNIVAFIVSFGLIAGILAFIALPLEALIILGVALITPVLAIFEYKNAVKQMRKIGHSPSCAKHIARTYALRSGRYTHLQSLDDKDAETIMKLAVNKQKTTLTQK